MENWQDYLPEIIQTEATTFSKVLSAIEKFQKNSDASWYRGCTSIDYTLEPSLYRHPTVKTVEGLLAIERKLTTRFVQRSLPYLQRRLVGDWDKLFFMQHYGVPTRLLDWTENPLVSAFFALNEESKTTEEKDAVIWMCNPIKWNRAAFKHISYNGGIFDEEDSNIVKHRPGTIIEEMPDTPIMMFGSYNSPRIVAQRGVFSLFGKSQKPMDAYYVESNFPARCLEKIVIPHGKKREIRDSLFRKGITESVVFPEVEGLAKELKRENGF